MIGHIHAQFSVPPAYRVSATNRTAGWVCAKPGWSLPRIASACRPVTVTTTLPWIPIVDVTGLTGRQALREQLTRRYYNIPLRTNGNFT